jgi:predicted transcriptional regulator
MKQGKLFDLAHPDMPAVVPAQVHSETSLAAAEAIRPRLGELQQRVLAVVRHSPATDEEIQDALGMGPSTERPRRVELVRAGLVRDSGETRATRSGRQAVVWEVTDHG